MPTTKVRDQFFDRTTPTRQYPAPQLRGRWVVGLYKMLAEKNPNLSDTELRRRVAETCKLDTSTIVKNVLTRYENYVKFENNGVEVSFSDIDMNTGRLIQDTTGTSHPNSSRRGIPDGMTIEGAYRFIPDFRSMVDAFFSERGGTTL